MTIYMKNFVFASLVYLGLAVVFGILNGVTDIGYIGSFAHTHFNLLGFMSMIVFGIGYFILPRFNGADLRFESWVAIHFYLGNISLTGMVLFRGLQVSSGADIYTILFVICAVLQAVSIFMFIINIWLTLTPKKVAPSEPAVQPAQTVDIPDNSIPNISVTPDTKIAELVDELPSLQQTLIDSGLLALQMPGHIDKVRTMGITIGTAAANHSLDLDSMILKIEKELQANGYTTIPNLDEYSIHPNASNPPAELTADTLIGDIISSYPKSKKIFQNYFGDGCFDCPGQSYESVDLACRMHGVHPDQFLKELKDLLK